MDEKMDPRRDKPLSLVAAISALEDRVSSAQEEHGKLYSALATVLSPETPMAVETGSKGHDEAISELTSRVCRITDTVNNLIDCQTELLCRLTLE